MNNKGVTFLQYLVLICVIAAGCFLVFPNHVPVPLGAPMDARKLALSLGGKLSAPSPGEGDQSLPGVVITPIPQAVYDGIRDNPEYQEYLFGPKKRILLLAPNGMGYAREYQMGLDRAFMSPEIQAAYVKDIVVQPRNVYVSCNSNHQNCPRVWLQQVCGEGICIINPSARAVAVDNSRDSGRLTTLLELYKHW